MKYLKSKKIRKPYFPLSRHIFHSFFYSASLNPSNTYNLANLFFPLFPHLNFTHF